MSANMTLYAGQLLMIEMGVEIFTGNLKLIDKENKIMELENVHNTKTNYAYVGSQLFNLPQITRIQVVHSDEDAAGSSDDTAHTSPSKTSISTPSHHNTDSAIALSPSQSEKSDCMLQLTKSELQQIQAQLDAIVVITQTDQSYHKALADIKNQSIVALVVEPADFGRIRKTSLVIVATHQKVYIFDIKALGSIFREFKVMLEAERPRKVVHCSHKVYDHLLHRQNVELAGVFDTFVAYCIVAGVKKPVTLIQTAGHCFNISETYFTYEDKLPFDTNRRPLTRAMCQFLAKKAIFQLKLQEHLLHKRMLANFYQQCSNFAQTFSSKDCIEIAVQMQPHSREGYQHIKRDGDFEHLLEAKLLIK